MPKRGPEGESGSHLEFSMAAPIEEFVNADGSTGMVVAVSGTNEEILGDHVKHLVNEHGARPLTPQEEKLYKGDGSSTFSFERWNAGWEPEVPKKNWGPAPDGDPHRPHRGDPNLN